MKAWNKKHGRMWVLYGLIILVSYGIGVIIGDTLWCVSHVWRSRASFADHDSVSPQIGEAVPEVMLCSKIEFTNGLDIRIAWRI